jgi:hypothetical protein
MFYPFSPLSCIRHTRLAYKQTNTVTNTGTVTSDYIALLFLSGTYGPRPYPLKTLAGYTRLRKIEPGKSATAEIRLTVGNLARTDESGNTVLYPGKYKLGLDVDGRSEIGFELQGAEAVLDWWPQPGEGQKEKVEVEVKKVMGGGDGLRMVNVQVMK